VGCDRAWSDIEDAIALAYEKGQRAARVAGHPTRPRDRAAEEHGGGDDAAFSVADSAGGEWHSGGDVIGYRP
jgi:hypothetical protein